MFIRQNAVILSLAGIVVALLSNSLFVLFLFHGSLVALCLLDIAFAPTPRSLMVERQADQSVRNSETSTETLILTNASHSHLRGELRNAWPASAGLDPQVHSFDLSPLAQTTASATFTPYRRGTLKSEHVTIRTFGPMTLAGRQKEFTSPWDLRVLPPFHSRKHLPSRLVRLRELEGRALLLVRGQGTEFDSLREYVAGDDVRAIDWRSTARLGHTVVRTWRPERDRKIVIVLDSGRAGAMRIGEFPAFDSFIESSLLLAALATKAGDQVSLFALDSEVHGRVKSKGSANIINHLAESLADVEPTLSATDWLVGQQTIDSLTQQSALVVILTCAGLGTVSDGLVDVLPQLSRRHRVLVGTLTSDDAQRSDQNTIFTEASIARSRLETAAILQEIKRLGAVVVTGSESTLAPRIADRYIDLKARGQL
ncbi:DUF58 domain-containing protein [Arcanobacterium ihumii]|uniref:DUF58 domain-containing protein n=1 Tax=Arcanobacterium ihumii TaxID=2138162 RepID=UPI000F543387|nr:DUF58 domain-containing protein [Arcanobacterium ihumii]